MRYYAFHHNYGINTTDTRGNIIGALYVFDTKQERDEWIEKDIWDGNYHRSTVNSKDARKIMSSCLLSWGVINSKSEANNLPTDVLVDMYGQYFY